MDMSAHKVPALEELCFCRENRQNTFSRLKIWKTAISWILEAEKCIGISEQRLKLCLQLVFESNRRVFFFLFVYLAQTCVYSGSTKCLISERKDKLKIISFVFL